jgi:hypothetical protein
VALQSARILPLTDLITWKYARVPGSNLTVVNLTAAVETTSYAGRDFELQYRDLIVAGALAEVSLKVGDVWGMGVDRMILPVVPIDTLDAASQDMPASLSFPGPVNHVVPSDTPQAAIEADKDLYGRDVILWETLARAASVLEDPPIESINGGLVLSEAWSLGEGDDVPDTVNAAVPLSVDLFKKPDRGLADRDNQLSAAIARAYEALADIYGRATRLLVKVDDSELNRDPDQYILYSDSSTERVWITTPGLSERSRVIFNKVTRQVTWISNYYTEQGSAPAALSTSFGAVNDFSVKARVPTRFDCEYYRQKSSQFRLGRFREIPVYSQPAANVDFVGGSAAFLGPDDIMLSSDGSYADLVSSTALVPGVYRFGFLYETRRTVRLFGALNDNPWPIVSATAATMTTSGEMTWAMKLEAGSYTLRIVFADLSANTPNFGIEIQYLETSAVTVYDGLLLYGYSGGKYITSPTYVLVSNGVDAVLTLRRTDNNAGQLTIDRIEISPASSDVLDFNLEVTNGSTTLPAKIYGVSGGFGCAYFDFPLATTSDVRIGLSALALGALYIKAYDIKKIELQRETPDIDGYRGWKRGWLEKALESVRQSWFTSTKLSTPSFLVDGLWTSNSTENWMNTIESTETRLRTAFRLARPTDVGQPALTPMGLSIDVANAVSLYDTTRLEPVLQALQPWMIRVGVYVAVEDLWPEYYVANAAGVAADFDAVAVPVVVPPVPEVEALSAELNYSVVPNGGDADLGSWDSTGSGVFGIAIVYNNIADTPTTLEVMDPSGNFTVLEILHLGSPESLPFELSAGGDFIQITVSPAVGLPVGIYTGQFVLTHSGGMSPYVINYTINIYTPD